MALTLTKLYFSSAPYYSGNLHNPSWGGDRIVGAGSVINRATGDIHIIAPYVNNGNTYTTDISAKVDGINMKDGVIVAYNFPMLARNPIE